MTNEKKKDFLIEVANREVVLIWGGVNCAYFQYIFEVAFVSFQDKLLIQKTIFSQENVIC